jgi:hypothetical protein
MHYPSALVGDLIHSLAIQLMCRFPTSAKDALYHDDSTDWSCLMMPKPSNIMIKTGGAAVPIPSDRYRQQWTLCPDMFPNLQNLDIELLVYTNDSMGHMCYGKRIETLMAAGYMCEARVKATGVSVRVYCEGCRLPLRNWGLLGSPFIGHLAIVKSLPKPGCTCEKEIEQMLVRMMKK